MLCFFGSTFEVDKKVLERVAKETFLYMGKEFDLNLRFVSKGKIRELNRIYRNRDLPTDVLSFNLEKGELGGDLVICYKEAQRQADKWHLGLTEAVALLFVHGSLHLAGFEHTKTADRDKMEAAEKVILKKAGVKVER